MVRASHVDRGPLYLVAHVSGGVSVLGRTGYGPTAPARAVRPSGVPSPPAESAGPAARGAERPGRAPHGGGEVALLPAPRAHGCRVDARRVAAHLLDAGSGGGTAAPRHRGGLLEQPAHARSAASDPGPCRGRPLEHPLLCPRAPRGSAAAAVARGPPGCATWCAAPRARALCTPRPAGSPSW